MINIRAPIWNGGKRCIGIADYRLPHENSIVEIAIGYTNKEGMKIYPNKFYVDKAKLIKYPVMHVKDTKLYIIPIADLEERNK